MGKSSPWVRTCPVSPVLWLGTEVESLRNKMLLVCSDAELPNPWGCRLKLSLTGFQTLACLQPERWEILLSAQGGEKYMETDCGHPVSSQDLA